MRRLSLGATSFGSSFGSLTPGGGVGGATVARAAEGWGGGGLLRPKDLPRPSFFSSAVGRTHL